MNLGNNNHSIPIIPSCTNSHSSNSSSSHSSSQKTQVEFIAFTDSKGGVDYDQQDDDVHHMIDHSHSRHAKSTLARSHPPLLNTHVASMISTFSTAARFSIRLSSFAVGTLFQALEFSTAATFGITRKTLVSAVSTARNLHRMASRSGSSSSSSSKYIFYKCNQ